MKEALRNHIEEITPITNEEWAVISAHFTERKMLKHQFLVQKGEPVLCDHWVVKGLLKAYTIDDNGKEHILQFAMENWWCSDYNAFQNQSPATIFIDCVENCEVLCLRLDDREKICREVHSMEHFFRVKSNYGYIALQQRILSLLTQSAEERYNHLLKINPRLFQRVPKKLIAAYLGVTRETLSRLNS